MTGSETLSIPYMEVLKSFKPEKRVLSKHMVLSSELDSKQLKEDLLETFFSPDLTGSPSIETLYYT
jgi:hypothetical protein